MIHFHSAFFSFTKATFFGDVSLRVRFPRDPRQPCVVTATPTPRSEHFLSLPTSLTSTGLPRGNKGSNQLARFVGLAISSLSETVTKEISALHIHHDYLRGDLEFNWICKRGRGRIVEARLCGSLRRRMADLSLQKSFGNPTLATAFFRLSSRLKYCFMRCPVMINKLLRAHNKQGQIKRPNYNASLVAYSHLIELNKNVFILN